MIAWKWTSCCLMMLAGFGMSLSTAHCEDKKETAKEETKTTEVVIKDLKLKLPASWKEEAPANNMRLAQYKPPAAEGDKPTTELVISSFGGDGGGKTWRSLRPVHRPLFWTKRSA